MVERFLRIGQVSRLCMLERECFGLLFAYVCGLKGFQVSSPGELWSVIKASFRDGSGWNRS